MTNIKLQPETDLIQIAKTITSNSEIFGDEIDNVIHRLAEIRETAERFGIRYSDEIPDCWGGTVKVTAYPSTRRTRWTF